MQLTQTLKMSNDQVKISRDRFKEFLQNSNKELSSIHQIEKSVNASPENVYGSHVQLVIPEDISSALPTALKQQDDRLVVQQT